MVNIFYLIRLIVIIVQVIIAQTLTINKSYGKLKSIPEEYQKPTIPEVSEITVLNLSTNQIIAVTSNSLHKLTKLEELNLDNNEIELIKEDCFAGLISLKILSLNNNFLTKLATNSFAGLINLEQLSLAQNEIKIIDAENVPFAGLINLKHLNLRGNRIENIYPNTFDYLFKLEQLDLNDVNITSIDVDSFRYVFDHCLQETNQTVINLSYYQINSNLNNGKCFTVQFKQSNKQTQIKSKNDLFDFDFNDSILPKGDDNYIGPFKIQVRFPFFGETYSSIFISTNGYIALKNPFKIANYSDITIPLIFPFFSDINTNKSGEIYYMQETNRINLAEIKKDINLIDSNFNPKWAFIAAWDQVASFEGSSNITNTFQAVLTTNETTSFVIFNYGTLMWPSYSIDKIKTYAHAGFNAGNSYNYYLIQGSATDEIINIQNRSNVNKAGKYIFRVDNKLDYINENKLLNVSNMTANNVSNNSKIAYNCFDLYNQGVTQDGIYEIHSTNNTEKSLKIYCEMSKGGWIRILNKMENDFNKPMEEYITGFGNLTANHWLGLNNIRDLTTSEQMSLRIELNNHFLEYETFEIGSSDEQFPLRVGKFINGDLPDILSNYNEMKFSAYDKDNDLNSFVNCAEMYSSGWWFNTCYGSGCLTCKNFRIIDIDEAFTKVVMLIRPKI